MDEDNNCLICGTKNIISQFDCSSKRHFFICPCCGRYELSSDQFYKNDKINDGLASYLFYNGFKRNSDITKGVERRYYTFKAKEYCDEYNEKADKESIYHGRPVHYDDEIINAWMPKTLSEKIDTILLKINDLTDYFGQAITLTDEELKSCFFVKRKKNNIMLFSESELNDQLNNMISYLKENKYLELSNSDSKYNIQILSKGYERIDALEKNNLNGKIVLVAMKFGDDTKKLRESIRKGIGKAGFEPVFIDEVEHNDYITPELLSYIRRSRFVVVDLTHKNNGAYFEEGYAMGLGKPVIQLCKKGRKLHFDIAQKNTIFWSNEEEIPERLCNRIKATINPY